MKAAKSTQFFAHFSAPYTEGGYSGHAGYQRKLARMMISTSFSTHAGCARHRACTVAGAYSIACHL